MPILTHKASHNNGFMGLLSISYVFKNLYHPILLHYLSSVQFLEHFPSPSPFSIFFFFFSFAFPQPCFHKPNPQYKTFLKIRVVLSSAIFCSNDVLITTPSSSTQCKCPYYHWNDLTVSNVSHSFDFSLFSFSFSLTLMSPGIALSIMAQLLSFLFTTAISGFLALISLSQWIITSHKIFTSSFSTTPSGACSYHFSLHFRLYFPRNF